MLGPMDPRKMQALMRQMGIKSEQLNATKVVIELEDKNIVIENPQVTKVIMQGIESFQISGDIKSEQKITSEDVQMVMEQTGVTESEAKRALEEANGDIAEAILSLQKE